MKFLIMIVLVVFFVGCYANNNDEITVRTIDFELGHNSKILSHEYPNVTLSQGYSTEMTAPLLSFSQEANNIFDKVPYSIDIKSSNNTRKNADLLIFINKNDMTTQFLEKEIFPIAIENNWKYKGKYENNYVFCNSIQDLLEIAPPSKFTKNKNEGYALVPQENIWNIGFFATVGGVQICLDRYNSMYE